MFNKLVIMCVLVFFSLHTVSSYAGEKRKDPPPGEKIKVKGTASPSVKGTVGTGKDMSGLNRIKTENKKAKKSVEQNTIIAPNN